MPNPDACAPLQTRDEATGRAMRRIIPWSLHLQAYEVYSHLFGADQSARRMADRGGFSECELIAFLSAHPFPRDEWQQRVDAYVSGAMPPRAAEETDHAD